ncbi:MAG: hypothetical protein WCX31_07345 [Salinivirgaceae bacterium]|jgi:hypothetical protein
MLTYKPIKNFIFVSILLLFLVLPQLTKAQNCSKKKLADKELREDFDYRGQSLFIELGNGDSTTLNIVLYSKQNYRLFVVGEQKLGKVDYEIIVPRKKFNRVVKDILPKKVTSYKKDPNGFYLYNNDGERIPIGEEMIQDTSWTRETSTIEEVVFNSRTSDASYWLATPSKTQLITIKVFVEKADKVQHGCIGIYVGREFANAYQFRR